MEKPLLNFLKQSWRPVLAYTYGFICISDFFLLPLVNYMLNWHLNTNTPYLPLTLQGAGLYHLGMAGVLGITSHGRSQEKINGVTE